MYQFSNEISGTNDIIYAESEKPEKVNRYYFKHEVYPHIYIPNRSAAHSFALKSEDSEDIIKLKKQVEDYNAYLDFLESIDGFQKYFIDQDFCVNKSDVSVKWGEEIAEKVFSMPWTIFATSLSIIDDYLFDKNHKLSYSITIDETKLNIPIGKDADAYPKKLNDYQLLWNWIDNGHDFCIFLWELLGADTHNCTESDDDDCDDDSVTYYFDFYDQIREFDPEIQLVEIFRKLEKLGYLKAYTIKPRIPHPMWEQYGKEDGSIDVALVDMSFMKNKLLMEQIELMLWDNKILPEGKYYFLTDKNNKQYLSKEPGLFGGHYELKIYGRLDCKNANNYVKKGQYVRFRVFFQDEETAVAAGYRPCGKCMPVQYKKWKEQQK